MAQARRQVSIFINGKEVEGTLANMKRELRGVQQQMHSNVVGSEKYEAAIRRYKQLTPLIDDHKRRLGGIEKTYSGLTAGATKFLGAAGIAFGAQAIISGLVNVGKEMVTLYDQAAKTDAQLKAALKSTGEVAGRSFEQLNAQAEQLQKFTLFDDDATKQAQALLVTFTKVRTEVFDQTIPLIQDYATAMATASGGTADLKTATIQVGKALQDPIKGITALGKAGVQFSEQQKAQIKGFVETGRVADAQRIILAELETQFGGSAKAAAAAGLGGLTIFKNRIDNIKESLGELITNELSELSPAVDTAITGIEDFVAAEKEGETATTTFGLVLQGLAKALYYVTHAHEIARQAGTKTRLFLQEELGPAWVAIEEAIAGVYNTGLKFFDFMSQATGRGALPFKPIDVTTFNKTLQESIRLTKEELELISSVEQRSKKQDADEAAIEAVGKVPPVITGETPEEKAAREARQKAREKEAERELNDQKNKAEKLLEAIAKFKEEERLLTLSENDRRLSEVAAKYQDEIDQAIELEKSKNEKVATAATAQKVELLRLQSEAVEAERAKIAEEELSAFLERLTAENEAQMEAEESFRESQQEIRDELKEVAGELFDAETEDELAKVQEKYNELLDLAKKFGIDVTTIEADVAKQREEEAKKLKEKLLAQENELFQAQKDVQLAKLNFMSTVADQIGAIAGDNAALQEVLFVFQKAVAVAEIIIQLQKQLAAIRAQWALTRLQLAAIPGGAALIPGTYGIQAAESTAAKIGAGAGIAAVVGATIAHFTQKKHGGFASVRGADDGQLYHARLIGQPSTGMLDYPHPVLTSSGILANEVGREYYVSHTDLRNPKVLNHVRAIENITTHRQRAAGGFAPAATAPSTPSTGGGRGEATDPALMQTLHLQNQLLFRLLSEGVRAEIGNDELLAMQRQIAKLNKVSGGRA